MHIGGANSRENKALVTSKSAQWIFLNVNDISKLVEHVSINVLTKDQIERKHYVV